MADMVSRVYSGFRGVDLRGEECNLSRSPDALNVWRDYRESEGIRTRPGAVKVADFDEPVMGIYFYNDRMIVQSGGKLYKVADGKATLLYSGVSEGINHGAAFVFNGIWYFLDGSCYLQYDGTTIKDVEGFVPTTSIARKPSGGGTIYQDVNLLTGRRINTFLADGESKTYVLDATNIDRDFAPIVKVNGAVVKNYTVNYSKGTVTFTSAPSAPATDGQDNVSVEFSHDVGNRKRIENCTLVQAFDNRVFFSGNVNFPNTVWHCSLDDPTYCSDLDYYQDGQDNAAIRGLVVGNNALWVFREPSDDNTTVFYHTPTLDADYGKIYPSQHSSVSTGCVGKAINFNDDLVFFSERGMEGISGDITTEQVVQHRSSLIDPELVKNHGRQFHVMQLAEWEGYLLVCYYDHIYLADSRTAFNNNGHTEYEWFVWDMKKTIYSAKVEGGILYLGCKDGVYSLTDNEGGVVSYWVTPKDKFKHPNKLKTTNKRGCVVEATGDVAVYAKTEDTDFTLIGWYKDIEDYFVSRIKQKKFKDIQLRFFSNDRFSLESVTLEAFIGGYIKR